MILNVMAMVVRCEAAFGLLSDYGNRIFLSELNMLGVRGDISALEGELL